MNEPRIVHTETKRKIDAYIDLAIVKRKCLLVTGPAGVGKTTAAVELARRDRRACYIRFSPAHRTMNAMLDLLLNSLGVHTAKRYINERIDVLREQLTWRVSASCLVLDEAQNLGLDVIRVLQELHDDFGLPIIFCGNRATLRRTRANADGFDQIMDRIAYRLDLAGPTRGDIEAFCIEYNVALDAHEGMIALGSRSSLRETVRILDDARALATSGPVRPDQIASVIEVQRGPEAARDFLTLCNQRQRKIAS